MENPNIEEITTVITHGTTELMQVISTWQKEPNSYGQEFETGYYSKDEWLLVDFEVLDMEFEPIEINVGSDLFSKITNIISDDFEPNYLNA